MKTFREIRVRNGCRVFFSGQTGRNQVRCSARSGFLPSRVRREDSEIEREERKLRTSLAAAPPSPRPVTHSRPGGFCGHSPRPGSRFSVQSEVKFVSREIVRSGICARRRSAFWSACGYAAAFLPVVAVHGAAAGRAFESQRATHGKQQFPNPLTRHQ